MAERQVPTITLAQHPRASASIRRAKARGGLAGFALAALGTWLHGGLLVAAFERGLAGGVVGYLVAWGAALTVWRHLVRAQVRAALERRRREAASRAST
jgi:hypothetical protein